MVGVFYRDNTLSIVGDRAKTPVVFRLCEKKGKNQMTPEVISSAAAVLLSLVFAYVPKADEWFAKLDAKSKAGILVGSIFLISAGAMGLSCANLFPGLTGLTCNQPGLEGLARSFVLALVANQTTYLIAPTSQKVKEINAAK